MEQKTIRYFIGYVLARDEMPRCGTVLGPATDELVQICTNPNVARRVLDATDKNNGWTRIYRVYGDNINCFTPCPAMMWTRMGHRLVIGDVVWTANRGWRPDMDDLIRRADACKLAFAKRRKLIRGR